MYLTDSIDDKERTHSLVSTAHERRFFPVFYERIMTGANSFSAKFKLAKALFCLAPPVYRQLGPV